MISSLSAYIQFIAAIYVTICIDSLICRRFWSPDYYNLVTRKLSLFDNTISTPKREKLEKQIRDKEQELDSRSRKRGAIMLTYCMLLLWYVGFEKPLKAETCIAQNISLATLSLLTIIALLVCKWLSRRWRYTLGTCTLIAIAFATLVLYVSPLHIDYPHLELLCYTKRAITVLVVLPIFYQLYVNWLYSKAYIFYLDKNINEEYKKYSSSKKGLEDKNEKLVDDTYNSAFTKILLNKIEGDNAMTELNNLLYKHLQVSCAPPASMEILREWWHSKDVDPDLTDNSSPGEEDDGNDEASIAPVLKEEEIDVGIEIIEGYKKYKSSKPSPKISDFCKAEGIDEDSFRSYHNLQKSSELRRIGLQGKKKKRQ